MTTSKSSPAPAATVPVAVELPRADVGPLVRAYKRAEKRVAAAKEAQEAAKAALLDVMGGAEVLAIAETHQAVAEHREVRSMVLDPTRLKAERPRIAAAYQKLRIQRPFKVLV
ncbi:hypothetical protein [Blastococcus sp. TF02A-26]|uniref:hypothetical protein n=1 Tax=Blastococcus sp. TF02A-26 TaxID=2250577 RepID=UPI001314B207|nr:hypothetical protein [Blastococcus sp. TF02A-26]